MRSLHLILALGCKEPGCCAENCNDDEADEDGVSVDAARSAGVCVGCHDELGNGIVPFGHGWRVANGSGEVSKPVPADGGNDV